MIEAKIIGLAAFQAHIEGKIAEANHIATRIVVRAQAEVERNAKQGMTGAHSKGTATPSRPGEPPSVVTGTLRRSITSDRVTRVGFAEARGSVYPTVVYARIQELGGTAGRGSVLPARPYMDPAHRASLPRIAAISLEEWARL